MDWQGNVRLVLQVAHTLPSARWMSHRKLIGFRHPMTPEPRSTSCRPFKFAFWTMEESQKPSRICLLAHLADGSVRSALQWLGIFYQLDLFLFFEVHGSLDITAGDKYCGTLFETLSVLFPGILHCLDFKSRNSKRYRTGPICSKAI